MAKQSGQYEKVQQCQQSVQPYEERELTDDQIVEMSEWFKYFDKNSDERLDRAELRKAFYALQWDLTDAEFEEIMLKADTNGDGCLDYAEYMDLLYKYRKDPDRQKLELVEAFRHFDVDRSGSMERNELRRVLMQLGITLDNGQNKALDKLFAIADKDGDGRIDLSEFVDFMLKKPFDETVMRKY